MTRNLKFYKDTTDNKWYLYIKWFPNFLKPLLSMLCGADRLLDILCMEQLNIVTQDEIERYYKNHWQDTYWLHCTVDTNSKINKPENFRFSLKLNKYLNREMKMDRIRDGRLYLLNTIDLYSNIEHLDNDENQYFDQMGLGNNIWLCFVTWFVFRFSFPKRINVSNVYANRLIDTPERFYTE